VICISPNYRKFDLHAVQVMGTNIELWRYQRFDNNTLYLEEIVQNPALLAGEEGMLSGTMEKLTPGKKAALTRATGQYTFDEHLEGKAGPVRELALMVQDYMLGLDPTMKECPKKMYIGYKTAQNVVCMQLYKEKVVLYVSLDPARLGKLPAGFRDVRKIGHHGTGNLEVTIKTEADFDRARDVILKAYQNLGG